MVQALQLPSNSQLSMAGLKTAGISRAGTLQGAAGLSCYPSQASKAHAAGCLAVHSEAGVVLGLPLISPKPSPKIITGHHYQVCYSSLCAVHILAKGCGHLDGHARLQAVVPASLATCLHICFSVRMHRSPSWAAAQPCPTVCTSRVTTCQQSGKHAAATACNSVHRVPRYKLEYGMRAPEAGALRWPDAHPASQGLARRPRRLWDGHRRGS